MLKIVKVKKTKRGFTLLETLLSVALLVIISAMMMNGFMASVNYSHNTSVYAKSAGSNYKEAMSKLALYATKANTDKKAAYSVIGAPDGSMSFTGTGPAVNLVMTSGGKLKLKVFKETDNSSNLHENIGVDQFDENFGSHADNRYAFNYVPGKNADGDGNHVGEIRIFRKNSTGEYYWGYKTTNADGTTTLHSLGKVNS